MSNLWSRIGLAVLSLGLIGSSLRAGAPVPSLASANDPAVLAAVIDRYIGDGYAAKKARPVAVADDAEFVRRVYLDLAGRIPRNPEVRKFLDDKSPDKRVKLVEKILEGDEKAQYINHMTRVWRSVLLPNNNNPQIQAFAPGMEGWLRKHFQENTPYDAMVRELITTNVTQGAMQPGFPNAPGAATGFVFFQANELKPENLAAATSRLFLGVKLECAQCHDHPFAKWSREQFWEYAAFFSGIGPQMAAQPQTDEDPDLSAATDVAHKHAIKMPGREKAVQARFLDGKQPAWKNDTPTRVALAEWMTSPENPFFARAAVNRVWGHLFGIGLIDPVDDLREDNPPSNPELLDALAKAFVQNHYDLKYLIRAITTSKTYQLTSAVDGSPDDPRLFARMSVKGLTAEQLYDSLALATGYADNNQPDPTGMNPFGGGGPRAEFIARFSNVADKRTETQTSILQALALMNGKITADATSLTTRSGTLSAALDSPFMDDHQKLDMLYLCALSRPMRPDEAQRMVKYVKSGGPSGDSRKALADVFWTLLNSSEFIFNH